MKLVQGSPDTKKMALLYMAFNVKTSGFLICLWQTKPSIKLNNAELFIDLPLIPHVATEISSIYQLKVWNSTQSLEYYLVLSLQLVLFAVRFLPSEYQPVPSQASYCLLFPRQNCIPQTVVSFLNPQQNPVLLIVFQAVSSYGSLQELTDFCSDITISF